MFRAHKLFAAAASAVLVATTFGTVAHARLPEPKPEPAAKQEEAAKEKRAQRYCMGTTSTGTRIVRQVCMTRDQWLAEGVDPLKQ
ncbi:hypothetical protein ACPVPU_05515 [Sphingomonas sp. CJ99]